MEETKQKQLSKEMQDLFSIYSSFDINTIPMMNIRFDIEKLVNKYGAEEVKKSFPQTNNKIGEIIKLISIQTINKMEGNT